jgi:3-hydroxybutyryl-CoA dehydrogenase
MAEQGKTVAVLGGGLMGAGIAQVFAVSGFEVYVFEPFDEVRDTVCSRIAENLRMIGGDESAADNVHIDSDLESVVSSASFVTEAVPEKLELKQSLFADLERLAPRDAILASNSSVIPITNIAEGLETADRMVGTHWWNPPYLIPLVEVIKGAKTSDATIDATMALMRQLGKEPAYVQKDVPGFVGNRLQHALWREAIAMVAEGICDAQTVDTCIKNSFGLRLPVLGPLENADLVGLDLTLDIHKTIIPELDRSSGPNPYLEEQVEAGKLGFKSGEGFMAWTDDEMAALRQRLAEHLAKAQRERNTSGDN